MGIPESEKTHNDLIDIIIEASQTIEQIEEADGKYKKVLQLDPEKIYWKTHIVNSPTFSQLVFQLKELEGHGAQAFHFMHRNRALVINQQIDEKVKNYKYAIDAKSSESLRDEHNTQSTLIDKINRNKIEKAYTVKGDMKKSFMDGLLGREAEQEAQDG